MDEFLFADLLDRYGDDLSAWPEPQQAEARELLMHSAAARTAMLEARSLRRAFESAPAIRAPRDLSARIVARALVEAPPAPPQVEDTPAGLVRAPRGSRWRELVASFWRPAAVLPACFVLGFGVGLLLIGPDRADAEPQPFGFDFYSVDR